MLRRLFVFAAVLTLVGAAVLYQRARPRAPLSPSPSAADPRSSQELTSHESSARVAVGSPPSETVESAQLRMGEVIGTVAAHDGTLLPRCLVRFSASENLMGSEQHLARSDEDGWYRRELRPGLWHVAIEAEAVAIPSGSARKVGKVQVRAGVVEQYHIVLIGDRALSGHVTLFDEDLEGLVLELELRPRWRPDELAGYGVAVSFTEPEKSRDPNPWSGVEEDDEPAFEPGAFLFPALDPEPYVLRVWLDRSSSLYLDREVDLTAGDARLDEALSFGDFFAAKIARGE